MATDQTAAANTYGASLLDGLPTPVSTGLSLILSMHSEPTTMLDVDDLGSLAENALAPVPTYEPDRSNWILAIDERLRRLGVKISPSMSTEQAREWRAVMAEALSDIPARVALTAAKRAIHKPMRFLNEVEGEIRVLAAEIATPYRNELARIERLKRESALASRPAAIDDALPLTADEVSRLSNSLIRLGIAVGDLPATHLKAPTDER